MTIDSVLNSLNTANRAVVESAKNAQQPEGSTRNEVIVQNNGSSGSTVIARRVTAPYEFEKIISAASVAGASTANFEYHSRLNSLVGDPKNQASIYSRLNNFINSFDSQLPTIEKRSSILANASSFTSQVRQYTDNLQDLKSILETEITQTTSAVNGIIFDLVSVNKALVHNSQNIGSVLDERNSLIAQLAEHLGIIASFDNTGVATVRIANGGKELVSGTHYAQLSYIQDLDLLSHNISSDIIRADYYDINGAAKNKTDTQVGDVISQFGGKFAGLLNVRDNILPEALANINNAVGQIAAKVNELHNTGSGYPPASTLTSERAMLLTDKASFKGKASFTVTDSTGNPVVDNAGNYVKPVTVDFDNLASRNAIAGQFTTQDIIDEINQVADGYSKASVGLGSIAVPTGEAPQWLVDQVRLVPTSDISSSGAMSFQIELNSGSSFDTKFQVTGMIVLDEANTVLAQPTAFTAPDAITLASGQYTKTGQNIVANFTPGETQSTIRLKMLVIGTDGVCEEKWADFTIGDGVALLGGSETINQRVEAASANNAIGGGLAATITSSAGAGAAATATDAKLGSAIISARFVDKNGYTVTDTETQGYLELSAIAGSGLVIDTATSKVLSTTATPTEIAKNLSHWYGINNFFNSDATNPATNIAVRADIAANSSLISLGKAEANSATQNIMKGQTLPSATLDLTILPVDNDTVTINGTAFTFKAALTVPAVGTEILIGADIPATLQNLYNVVKANTTIVTAVTFAKPAAGATQLTVIAKTAGADIAVASSVGGADNQWKVPANGNGGVVGDITTKLTGGYASAILDCSGANIPANGDVVTINGVPFVFGIGAGQVSAAGGSVAAMTALKAALNASTDIRISGLFTFSTNIAGDKLIATATSAGAAGNNLKVTSVIAAGIGGNAWSRPNAPAFAAVTSLIGGVDIESTSNINTHALKIGPDSNNIFLNLSTTSLNFDLTSTISQQTIYSFFNNVFQTKMDHMLNDSELQNDIDKGVLEYLQKEFDRITKLSSDTAGAEYFKFIEFSQYANMLVSLINQIIKNRETLLKL